MRRILRGISSSLVLGALVATSAEGQSVADIVDRMYEAYERHAAGVDNYTLVQTMMGFESVNYFEKEMVDGKPVFRLRNAGIEGLGFGLGDEDAGQRDIFLIGLDLVEHARYRVGSRSTEARFTYSLSTTCPRSTSPSRRDPTTSTSSPGAPASLSMTSSWHLGAWNSWETRAPTMACMRSRCARTYWTTAMSRAS